MTARDVRLGWSLAGAHAIPDSAHGGDETGLGCVVAELASQVADMDVDEMFVADPRALAHDFEELAAAEHHTWPAGQGFQDVEFGAGEQDRFLVEAYFAGINVDAQRSEPPRRGGRVLAVPAVAAGACRTRGRRSMARIRATSSRGLNGLVM